MYSLESQIELFYDIAKLTNFGRLETRIPDQIDDVREQCIFCGTCEEETMKESMLKDVKLEMKWNIFGKQQRIAADLLINEAKCSSNVFSLHTFGVSEQFYFLVGSIASAFAVLVCLWKWDALWCPNCRLLFDEFGANWEVYPNMIANVVKMLKIQP